MESIAAIRVGDRDRERAADHLGMAVAQGYLDLETYDQRLRNAYSVEMFAELTALTADLPLHQLRRHDPRRTAARNRAARTSVRIHLAGYLAMVAIVLTVWLSVALTGGSWYFWPVWPIMGAGIGLVSHAIPIRCVTRSAQPIRRMGGKPPRSRALSP